MSKYIIELEDDIKYLIINGRADNRCYTLVRPVAELEVLNSDYINEHYGELQDEAYKQGYADAERIWRAPSSDNEFYRKGLEDGKKSIDNGCNGCKYEDQHGYDEPCNKCMHSHASHYTPMPKQDDSIKVGDEVTAPCGKAIVTAIKNEFVYYLYADGDCGCTESKNLKKTGKHYDIASILEAMRA